jgi:hypothetical protein
LKLIDRFHLSLAGTGGQMSRSMILLALASVVSPGVAQKVRVDYEHGCNFSRYKTYSWVQSRQADAEFPNQLMQQRIVGFVEEALAAKHFTRVERDADLLVAYDIKVNEQPQYTTYTDSVGPGWGGWGCCGWAGGWGGGFGSAFSTTFTETISLGTLVVNMSDARQKQLVFQGVSTATISSRAEKNAKRLQKGINEMFEKYPPRK